jgi:adenine phosphoribosyltransferase
MKILRNELKNTLKIRTEKDFPVKGIEFIDITPLIIDKDLFNEITFLFVNELKNKKVDYILAPEARGFIFATSVAYELNTGIVPIRKKGKLPPTTVAGSIEYEKEYGKDYLELPKLVDEDYKGKRFYIIDDIYATGNTARAIKDEIESLGGVVAGIGAVINIKELNNDKDVYSIIDINES